MSITLLIAFFLVLIAGCSTATRSQKAAVIGAADGNTAKGAVIGRKIDKQVVAIANEM